MATEIRLKQRFQNRVEIVRMANKRLVNFGTKGAFKRPVGETMGAAGFDQLIASPTQDDFAVLHKETKMCEVVDLGKEKALLSEINAKKTDSPKEVKPVIQKAN